MTKTFKQIRELTEDHWDSVAKLGAYSGTKGAPGLLNYATMKRHSRDSTSGSLTDKQIQNLKKTWNNPSKVFTKDAEQFVKNMVKKLDNDSRHRLAKAGIKHISKLAESGDVPKGHEYGPSSRKRPAGKAGYTSSDDARTTHLKSIKRDAKKKRRQGDKNFANEEVKGSLFKKGAKVKYVGDNPRYKGKTGTVANVHGTEDNVKYAITGILKGTLAITVGTADIQSEEAPANATGTAVAGTGDDSSTVLVKKRKELQKRLMRRFAIKETLDRILPDPVETEDEITTRKKQLKELAKNRNV